MTAATKLAEAVGPLDCYACPGRFQLAKCGEKAAPVARHTEPYCEPFRAVETVLDATDFAERCVREAERRRAWADDVARASLANPPSTRRSRAS